MENTNTETVEQRLAKKGLSLESVGGDDPPRVVSTSLEEETPQWREWKLIRDVNKGVAALISRMMAPIFPRFSIEVRFFRPDKPDKMGRHFQPFSRLENDIVTISKINYLALRMVLEEAETYVLEELQRLHNIKVERMRARMSFIAENK